MKSGRNVESSEMEYSPAQQLNNLFCRIQHSDSVFADHTDANHPRIAGAAAQDPDIARLPSFARIRNGKRPSRRSLGLLENRVLLAIRQLVQAPIPSRITDANST